MSAPVSALFEHNQGRFAVLAARAGSINLAVSSFYSFLAELAVKGEFWHPKAGDVVVDVGAAFGAYSLPAMVDGACVHCFEPDLALFHALTANIAENVRLGHIATWVPGWDARCYQLALSDVEGVFDYEPEPGVWFNAKRLDSFDLPRLDWLKCDTEGYEAHVLRGAEQTIRRCKPNLLLEAHEFRRSGETSDLLNLVESLGYADAQLLEAGIVNYIFAARSEA